MKHGWYYYYRLHDAKCSTLLEEYPSLHNFLNEMFDSCPHEHFITGPRSSSLTFPIDNCSTVVENHETCNMTSAALVLMSELLKGPASVTPRWSG